ncbi:MAG: tannase/feruloyl esterase family alpha/beta hydrolase [Candidatus Bathyarchaeia archaeon]
MKQFTHSEKAVTKMQAAAIVAMIANVILLSCVLQSYASTANSLKEFFDSLGLTDTEGNPVTILSAETVTDVPGAPEHVRVEGVIWPETQFVIKLPISSKWNGRYYQIGGAGLGGTLLEPAMLPGIMMGYATGGNNQGHNATREPGATFAYPDPIPGIRREPNPYWQRKEEDYAYRASHETAVLAKKIIKAYYGREPLYSYFVGSSNGGREGLKLAQIYPEDFDGMVIGMPVLNITWEALQDVWNAHATLVGPGAIPVSSLPFLAQAVYEKCDSVDGLVDGLIDDPRKCAFDPIVDLAETPYSNYFTLEQRESLAKIYEGPKTSWGLQLFYGTPVGGEAVMRHVFGGVMSNWAFWVVGEPNLALSLGGSIWQYMATEPRFGPEWDWRNLNFDVDPFRLRPELAEKLNAISPDLRAFKERGGKIIHWHGWADQLVTPYQSIAYYESVVQFMGKEAANEFYKLYMVPGLTHVGSIGCSNVDWFTPLVKWVENGVEPKVLIGSRNADPVLNLTARTRPIPPYPLVARYIGKGSIDDAENFVCVELIPTEVQIKPSTISLTGGNFTAYVNIPEGYNVREFIAVTCEGAAALRVYFAKDGRVLIAEFNPRDLINVKPREDFIFTVTAIFEQNGQKFAFEGSDTVKVTAFDLEQEYDKLLLNYTALKDDYARLQEQFTALQQNYSDLNSAYSSLANEHKNLQSNYTTLKSEYTELNQTLKQIQSELNGLKANYTLLKVNYGQLQSSYETLQQDYAGLKNWQYATYAFIVLTFVSIATTIYFARKKPK